LLFTKCRSGAATSLFAKKKKNPCDFLNTSLLMTREQASELSLHHVIVRTYCGRKRQPGTDLRVITEEK
jgi:hypothetical protein